MAGRQFTTEEAGQIGERIGMDWSKSKFGVEEFRIGLGVELEHGLRSPESNVTNDDLLMTGKIALAHLNEFFDYYARLRTMEEEAVRFHSKH